MNNIGVIGGNGYTICSGSGDKTIRIWDIETTKQLNVFKGHEHYVGVVHLWDIRSGQQIQMFNGHTDCVMCVEYSPLVVNNIKINGNSNVVCSGSCDDTIRFWDIRSNKKELYVMKGIEKEDCGITYLKFIELKKKAKNNKDAKNSSYFVLKNLINKNVNLFNLIVFTIRKNKKKTSI
ncbi:hypothetical protein RFI_25611 [Reticulomyxa filosa]|uniref:WD-40 repeat protein n=1 Tax=Reticulomyxa filosa TaxID=46433 RepID=X6MDM8_RETFI|nr:hypothetical protein RFI_25611 [Reticulomyxa filosa]|eukprot:ETO11766.1 hypothetical protein RFI_25611 [Reticulomyxa filosa]